MFVFFMVLENWIKDLGKIGFWILVEGESFGRGRNYRRRSRSWYSLFVGIR